MKKGRGGGGGEEGEDGINEAWNDGEVHQAFMLPLGSILWIGVVEFYLHRQQHAASLATYDVLAGLVHSTDTRHQYGRIPLP